MNFTTARICRPRSSLKWPMSTFRSSVAALSVFALVITCAFYLTATHRLLLLQHIYRRPAPHRTDNVSSSSAANCRRCSASTSSAPCSFPLFRQHLLSTNSTYLTGEGVWARHRKPSNKFHREPDSSGNGQGRPEMTSSSAGGHDLLYRYRPAICSLEHGAWLPRRYLSNSLCRQRLSYVVITGDSNAWRLFRMAGRYIIGGGPNRNTNDVIRCDRVASYAAKRAGKPGSFEGGSYMPDRYGGFRCEVAYQLVHWHLPPDYFRCTLECFGSDEREIVVQFLPMVSEWTPMVPFVVPEATGCWNASINETQKFARDRFKTYQEFLYLEYFAIQPRPDLILHFSSNHEQASADQYVEKVNSFVQLLRRVSTLSQHQQPTHVTKIVFVSKPMECVRLKPQKWQAVRYGPQNLTRPEWIRAANRLLHDRIAPLFVTPDNGSLDILLFPDLMPMMEPVIDEIAVDGVHSSTFWYRTLWSFIIQTLDMS